MREYGNAKEQHIGLETMKDALVFEASIKDWTATFETKAIVGTRALRARLLDSAGKEIATASQPLVIDNTPPIARLLSLPPVKRGMVIEVQAEALDAESGVAQVVFFLARPDKGEIPASAVKLKATAANPAGTLWTMSLLIPAKHKGPLPISVHVVNNAGMASVDMVTIDVPDLPEVPTPMPKPEPVKTGLGEIRGKVVEGPRPQPNLVVTLIDERGKEIARTRTGLDGAFVFDRLPPGRYRLLCVKPESQRRATQGGTVDPDRLAKTELSLSL